MRFPRFSWIFEPKRWMGNCLPPTGLIGGGKNWYRAQLWDCGLQL
jgi:hypothetical protein